MFPWSQAGKEDQEMTLRVKLEIIPHGDEGRAYEIGRLDIFNKGHIDFGHCAYGVIEQTPEIGALHDEEIFHRRDLGAWELVRKAIEELEIKGP